MPIFIDSLPLAYFSFFFIYLRYPQKICGTQLHVALGVLALGVNNHWPGLGLGNLFRPFLVLSIWQVKASLRKLFKCLT